MNESENVSDTVQPNGSYGSAFQPGWYYTVVVMIWKIFPAIIIPIGTLGNLLTVLIILRQRKNVTSTTLLLICLACSDTLILYGGPLRNFISATWHFEIRNLNDAVCKIHSYLTYVSFQLSSWLLVMLTLERTVCVMFPHRVKELCIVKNTGICVVVVTLSILLLNSHFLYGAGLVEDGGKLESFPCRAKYETYEKFSKFVWPWIDFCVYFAIPFSFIVTGNVLIIKKLALARRERQMLQNRKTCRQSLQSKNVTVLLLFLCAMFLITLAPVTVYFIGSPHWIESITSKPDPRDIQEGMEYISFWFTVTNCISYLNATCNFILYVLSGSRFRNEVVSILLCRKASGSTLF